MSGTCLSTTRRLGALLLSAGALVLAACGATRPDAPPTRASAAETAQKAETATATADDRAGTAATRRLRAAISRGADGVPHIVADDWASLGWGTAYVQAQDDLCTMAEAFVTYRGERARYFGPDGHQRTASTLGEIDNLDSDFLFRLIDDDARVAAYRAAQPPRVRALVDGFAAGYNRYLEALRAGGEAGRHLACRQAPWLAEITPADVYRRLFAANIAGGLARFGARIAQARPPAADRAKADAASDAMPIAKPRLDGSTGAASEAIPNGKTGGVLDGDPKAGAQATPDALGVAATAYGAARFGEADQVDQAGQAGQANTERAGLGRLAVRDGEFEVGGGHGIGSNALAFGAAASQGGRAVLLGNPHWFLEGPDRFYQMRLTVPGELDVAGVGFLGVPVVMIGYNQDIAWTHTVSAARRFGVFQLALASDSPTTYLEDGRRVAMQAVPLTVQVRQPDGTLQAVTRTLYRTVQGPVLDLGALSPALRWQAGQAFVLRDINADNYRIFENFLAWGQAGSLDAFVAIQRRMAAMPWVNTVAIGRGDPRVWFGDVGAVPNVSDALAARCTTPLGRAFAAQVPGVPFLDGTRADCAWPTSAEAVQPGAMPASAQPQLFRQDFVANMNNTHWLVNPAQPLTGFAAVLGGERGELGLRPRLGFRIAAERIAGSDRAGPAGASVPSVAHVALDARSMSALLFKRAALDAVCVTQAPHALSADIPGGPLPTVVDRDPLGGAPLSVSSVDLREACEVLARWDDTGGRDARGAVLWDAWWARIMTVPESQRYAQPFDPARPLATPAMLSVDRETLARMLGIAVVRLREGGFTPQAERGAALYAVRHGVRIPWFGGCDDGGYFTSGCADQPIEQGGQRIDAQAIANTYLQVVSFPTSPGDETPMQAMTLMAGAQSDDPASPHYVDGMLRYARQQWASRPIAKAGRASADGAAPQEHVLDSASPAQSSPTFEAPGRAAPSADWRRRMPSWPAREASALLGMPEARLVAGETGADSRVSRLDVSSRSPEAWFADLAARGPLDVMVRNEQAIAERDVPKGGTFAAAGLRRRGDAANWHDAFAVTRYYPSDDGSAERSGTGTSTGNARREAYREVQFFDSAGGNVLKLHPLGGERDPSAQRAFDAWVARHQSSQGSAPARGETSSADAVDGADAQTEATGATEAVEAVEATEASTGAVRRGAAGVARCAGDASQRLSNGAARLGLAAALALVKTNRMPVRIDVFNPGAEMTHRGRVVGLDDIGGGWLSVRMAGYRLHVRPSGLEAACVDRAGAVTLLDAVGVPAAVLAPAAGAEAGSRSRWRALWAARAIAPDKAPGGASTGAFEGASGVASGVASGRASNAVATKAPHAAEP
ncbi:penicillin acylase family protein [Chitinasiproducens palmae]|uniref:Acyl-homoserine-lactone acylase n=1 Tax=Chitinasiproducens palmae TaxID=1770053 RepID=A0A1H2PJK4_9BURK|nr:penicillin acylase family protein [Chitinasiproducens palmae]SDV46048.1 acyl-homoserine-lactone acylase [Chitinasiproducens palmae]